ncbi:hypothetical protein [Marinicrinis sediminis]|uniref:Secreted protein n=1 Tax=Marinicrinis sediminis TaxID=1652465 RepID=A0ABW5REK8_9BACL
MTKKWMSILLTLVLSVSMAALAGCGNNEAANNENIIIENNEPTTVPEEGDTNVDVDVPEPDVDMPELPDTDVDVDMPENDMETDGEAGGEVNP